MTAVGGPIEHVAIDGRLFPVAADADANRSLGGFTNAVESNGNGSARLIKSREPWSIAGLNVAIDDSRQDQEFLQEKANSLDFFDVEVKFCSGIVVNGRGQLTDKIETSSAKATCPISLNGPGELTAQ